MADVGIFVGTVYGNALFIAEEAVTVLQQHGHKVELFEAPELENWQKYSDKVVLIVTSTTGQGDFPDGIAPLYYDIQQHLGYQPQLRYGVIALGDSSYDYFCRAGKQFDELLHEQKAVRIGNLLTIDAMETPEPEKLALPWIKQWGEQI